MESGNNVEALRRRAQWYRDFAAVGSADNKTLRLSLAKNFDRQADEAAERAARHIRPASSVMESEQISAGNATRSR
jgi:hypothetical protein